MAVTLEKVKSLLGVKKLPIPKNKAVLQGLLNATEELISEHGEKWISDNKHRLRDEWEFCVNN
jgi:hypothetical protein